MSILTFFHFASKVPVREGAINLLARRVELGSQGPDETKWQKVMLCGVFHRADFPGGSMTVTSAELQQMITNWQKSGGNGLPIDQFHWGSSNDTRVRAEDKKAKGWIEDLRLDKDGDLEGLIKWTDDGHADIKADRLRYFSPSFHPDWSDQHTGKSQGWTLFGGGLLNDPYLTELPRMAASIHPVVSEPPMNPKLLAMLAAAGIQLKVDAKEAEVTAALTQYEEVMTKTHTEKDEAVKLSATLKVQADAVVPIQAQLTAKSNEVIDLTARLTKAEALKAEAEKVARDAAIDAAWDKMVMNFEVVPAKKAAFIKIALALGVADAVAAMGGTKVVPVGEKGTGGSGSVETTDEAKSKLQALAAEHMKATNCLKSEAMRFMMNKHPELAVQVETVKQ